MSKVGDLNKELDEVLEKVESLKLSKSFIDQNIESMKSILDLLDKIAQVRETLDLSESTNNSLDTRINANYEKLLETLQKGDLQTFRKAMVDEVRFAKESEVRTGEYKGLDLDARRQANAVSLMPKEIVKETLSNKDSIKEYVQFTESRKEVDESFTVSDYLHRMFQKWAETYVAKHDTSFEEDEKCENDKEIADDIKVASKSLAAIAALNTKKQNESKGTFVKGIKNFGKRAIKGAAKRSGASGLFSDFLELAKNLATWAAVGAAIYGTLKLIGPELKLFLTLIEDLKKQVDNTEEKDKEAYDKFVKDKKAEADRMLQRRIGSDGDYTSPYALMSTQHYLDTEQTKYEKRVNDMSLPYPSYSGEWNRDYANRISSVLTYGPLSPSSKTYKTTLEAAAHGNPVTVRREPFRWKWANLGTTGVLGASLYEAFMSYYYPKKSFASTTAFKDAKMNEKVGAIYRLDSNPGYVNNLKNLYLADRQKDFTATIGASDAVLSHQADSILRAGGYQGYLAALKNPYSIVADSTAIKENKLEEYKAVITPDIVDSILVRTKEGRQIRQHYDLRKDNLEDYQGQDLRELPRRDRRRLRKAVGAFQSDLERAGVEDPSKQKLDAILEALRRLERKAGTTVNNVTRNETMLVSDNGQNIGN